uniref:Gamma-glutamyltranspeptidase 3 n=1 Tax=Schistocephalus solidus TaxID=70667 RepID=A0A0X3PWW6_SCHSO
MNRPTDKEMLIEDDLEPKRGLNGSNVAEAFPGSPSTGTLTEKNRRCIVKNLSALNIIYLSVLAVVVAVTVALILSIFFGPPQVTPHASVITDSSYCSKAGKSILEGGKANAVDAVVSVVLCLSVVRPDVAGLGGCSSFFVHKPDGHTDSLFDAMCTAPSGAKSPDASHPYTTVGIPGLVGGLKTMHQQFGKKSWSSLFDVALYAARFGFPLDRALVSAADAAVSSNPPLGGELARNISAWARAHPTSNYPAQPDLAKSLEELSVEGSTPLYSGRIGSELVQTMTDNNVPWSLVGDLSDYRVQRPKSISTGMAGFNLKAFPPPFVGGLLTANALTSVDLRNVLYPLDAAKLASGNVAETATLFHRLIEITKLIYAKVSWLGDPYDPVVGPTVETETETMLKPETRRTLVEKVDDAATLRDYGPISPSATVLENIGDTFVVITDSENLMVAATLVLGAPFGSGVLIPNTGIHLNAALRLFAPSNSSARTLNLLAPGRRPLVFSSPLLLETAQRRCGHRFIMGGMGGAVGGMAISQVTASSLLFLSSVSCKESNKVGADAVRTSNSTAKYTPAVDSCLPLEASMKQKRFYPTLEVSAVGGSINNSLILEHGFSRPLASALQALGHKTTEVSAAFKWTGVVGSVGWTKYTIHSAADPRLPDSLAAF